MLRIVSETGNVMDAKIYLDGNDITNGFCKATIDIDASKGTVSAVLTAPLSECDIAIGDEYVKHEKGKADED